jgi:hypothetical protein
MLQFNITPVVITLLTRFLGISMENLNRWKHFSEMPPLLPSGPTSHIRVKYFMFLFKFISVQVGREQANKIIETTALKKEKILYSLEI